MSRIIKHVDYGGGAGPKIVAPAPNYPHPVMAKSPNPTSIKRKRLNATPNLVFEWLKVFADKMERAPTREEITKHFGHHGNTLAGQLALSGRLVIEVYGKNWRVFRFGEIHTALPPTSKKPYRVINKDGDRWFTGGSWHRYGQ